MNGLVLTARAGALAILVSIFCPSAFSQGVDSQTAQVSGSTDDAEERFSDGGIDLTSTDIELGDDPGFNEDQMAGLRFNGLSVPQGATITQAYITFTTDEVDTGTTIVDIHAQAADSAATFTSATNNLTGRPLTVASVTWDIPAWNTIGEQHDSPDLSSLVQEVVDRPGWLPGNSMAFLIFGTGSRTSESFDGSTPGSAARLFVAWEPAPTVGNPPVAGFSHVCNNLACSFTDTSTDSDGTVSAWAWDFGGDGSSTAQNPGHTFSSSGNYSVSLLVTDNDGNTDNSVQNIAVGAPQVTRGPYLQSLTDGTVIVRWRTDVATDSVVRYGVSAASLSSTASVGGSRTEHAVTLSGLTDHAQYFYAVGDSTGTLAGDASFHFTTAPVPGTAVPTRFWVIGDSGTANANARAVRDAYKAFAAADPSHFMLMLGDNAYLDGTDAEYQAAVFDTYPELLRQLPLWSALGNHDGHTADSASQSGPYYDIFEFPTGGEAGGLASGTEAYYAFDYGNIHFVVLDSYESNRSVSGSMMTWLESDLAANDKPWVIAFWHHPPYTKGSHDSDSEGRLIDMRQNALPILEAWGVDLVLSGHSHSYERSMLIDGHYDNSTTLDIGTMILDIGDGNEAGDGAYQKPQAIAAANEGAVYAVAGSSGKTSNVDPEWPHPVMVSYLVELGSMVIDVDGDRLDAVFLDDLGEVRDQFTILKSDTSPPPPPPPPSSADSTAVADLPSDGAVTGSYADTAADDGTSQSIQERESGGKRDTRYSYLQHGWQFILPAYDMATLHANIWHGGSPDDDFEISWSTDGSTYTSLFTVSSTDPANTQAAVLPGSPSGTVYVRISDTDRTPGNRSRDTVFVDHLFIRSENAVGNPPAAPTGLSASAAGHDRVDLAWSDNSGNESGFHIERSSGGGPFSRVGTVGADVSTHTDTGLAGGTAYSYQVLAFNASGVSAPSNSAGATTDPAPPPPAISLALAGRKVQGRHVVDLTWAGAASADVDIHRDGALLTTVGNTGAWSDHTGNRGGQTYRYQLCEAGTSDCSAEETITF